MTKKDKAKVLEIVRTAMFSNISSDTYIAPEGGVKSLVTGTREFIEEVEEKLNEL